MQLRDLQRAIDSLPEAQRQAVLFVGLEGMEYEDAAAVLEIPVGTLRSRLSRARERLRELMEEDATITLNSKGGSTMPLDVAATPQTLTAMLHYLRRGAEKPARYLIEPPPGVPVWNGIDDPHEVTIADARGREAEFTLDRNGFALIKAPTAVADFYSPEEIRC